jgi:polar amino acid transport system substrate-binding protein
MPGGTEAATALPAVLPAVAAPLLTAAVLAAALLTACDLPRDPEGTLAAAAGGTLLVGVAESPPWVVRRGDEAAGVEADLVRAFAAELGAEVEWVWGGVDEHLGALERFELDLVAAGLEGGSPWSKKLAFTRPYLEAEQVVGVPPGMAPPERLDGLRVAVAPGDALAAALAERDAVVVRSDRPWESGLPVAAPRWEVAARGYTSAGEPLGTTPRVLAAPPGENGLLVRLERFLAGQRPAVVARLVAEGAR